MKKSVIKLALLACLFMTTQTLPLPLIAARFISLASGTAVAIGFQKMRWCRFLPVTDKAMNKHGYMPYEDYENYSDDSSDDEEISNQMTRWWIGKRAKSKSSLSCAYVYPLYEKEGEECGVSFDFSTIFNGLGIVGGTYALYEFLYWKTPEGMLKWGRMNVESVDESVFAKCMWHSNGDFFKALGDTFASSDLYLAEAYIDFQDRFKKSETAVSKLEKAMEEGSSRIAQEAQGLVPNARRAVACLKQAIEMLRSHEKFENQMSTWKIVKSNEELARAQRQTQTHVVIH